MSLKCAVILALVLVVYTIETAEAQQPAAPVPWPADINQAWTTMMNFLNPMFEAARNAVPGWPPAAPAAAAPPPPAA